VPPLIRRSHVERSTSACDPKGQIQDFTYDAQNRLLTATALFNYTAWDSFGRPTAGSIPTPAGLLTVAITYDNTARTSVQTTTLGSNRSASVTTTFDVNGNVTGLNEPIAGTNVVTTTTATGSVCQ
jgi:YD repeat-containing protein